VAGDASGNGNSGAIFEASWTSGRFGSALDFVGAGMSVSVPNASSLNLTNALTLEAWVYPTSLNGWSTAIYKGAARDLSYGLFPSSGANRPNFSLITTKGLVGVECPFALPLNAWSHIAGTYDGAQLILYVNGDLVATFPASGAIRTGSDGLSIGGNVDYGEYFQGKIDEVRIYSRALPIGEIQADRDSRVDPTPLDLIPPVVSIGAPVAGAVVSHVTTINANASDNTEVASVEFFVDGASVGVATTAPYFVPWNSVALANGAHQIFAIAMDTAGNSSTSAPVRVTTLNPVFINEIVVPDITSATTLAFLPDGRMIVGELTENVWIVQPGASQADPDPFLEMDDSELFGEQGLMDIVLDPHFADDHYIYIFYTHGSAGRHNRNRVSRFTVSGNSALPESELVLWQDIVDAREEHHGGALAFGVDGKLFISLGEQFNPDEAQDLRSYHGKLLRINPDGTVPTDNPFYDGNGPNLDAIWALGLRNPFRMSVDPVTGRLYIGDVGGNDVLTSVEELNLGVAGANYGWPLCEGDCDLPGITSPIYSYPHNGRDACIVAGFVYRGSQFPSEYYGTFFVGDYVQNWLKRLTFDGAGNVIAALNFEPPDGSKDGPYGDPVKLIEGPDGSLYYVDIGFNDAHVPNPAAIRRIRYSPNDLPPVVEASAQPNGSVPPVQVSFSSDGSFDPEGAELTYHWTFGDGAWSTEANPVHTYGAAGRYVARLAVSDGVHTALSDDLDILIGNRPHAVISSPVDGSTFRAGDVITFAGTATDVEDGILPAGRYSWDIIFHHEGHIHPGGGPFTNRTSGIFVIPSTGHDFSGHTSYEIILSVTDSDGLTSSTSVTIFPEKRNLYFDTSPTGLSIDLGGIRKTTPFTQDALIGFQYMIDAPLQAFAGSNYQFLYWSDGGAQTHQIVVLATDRTITADFFASTPSALVAAYGFEEPGGPAITDSSVNANNGTIAGVDRSIGHFGQGLSFSRAGALVQVPDSLSLHLQHEMTLEAWVHPFDAAMHWTTAIFKGAFGDLAYGLFPTSDAGLPNVSIITANGLVSLDGPQPIPFGQWSHLAASYDGSALRLYVNGLEVGNVAASGNLLASPDPLTLGGDLPYGEFFLGQMDELRIYNKVLTPAEIKVDMNASVALHTAPTAFDYAIDCLAGQSAQIRVSTMLTDDFDEDGDPIQFLGVNATSVHGASVVTSGDYITYSAPVGMTNDDSFTYFIADDRGAFSTGTVTVSVRAGLIQGPTLQISRLPSGAYKLHFAGVPGMLYTVESKDQLDTPNWTPLGPMTQVGSEWEVIDSSNPDRSQRFYHARVQ